MPRYYFSCTFVYDGTRENIHRGLSQWLNDLGDDFTVKLKSSLTDGVPTVDFFREALATFPEDSLSLAFQLTGTGGSGRGTLSIARPSEKREYSKLELQFSVSARSKGLFASGEEVRHALLSAASSFHAEVGQVEADDFSDEESSRKYAVFQQIRDIRIPVDFEWVNVFRADVFQAIGWDLASLPNVSGTRFGEERGYVWLLLSEDPFSYKANTGTEAQRLVEDTLDLRSKQRIQIPV